MKVIVGGRELIASTTLQCFAGEDAWVEFFAGTWNVRLNIVFVDNKTDAGGFILEDKGDHAVITFRNWTSNFPSSAQSPFLIGDHEGRNIYMVFSGYAVQSFKRMDLSFFWEAARG